MAIQKKICMLGSFGVGKTSLVSQFVHSIFSEEYLTTIGVKIDKKEIFVDDTEIRLILWDLAGDDRFDNLQSTYLMGSSAHILVVDGCRLDTLDVARDIVEKHGRLLGNLPFICAINKSDLRADWEVKQEHIDELRSLGWEVVFTTATDRQTVESLFMQIGQMILDHNPVLNA